MEQLEFDPMTALRFAFGDDLVIENDPTDDERNAHHAEMVEKIDCWYGKFADGILAEFGAYLYDWSWDDLQFNLVSVHELRLAQ